MPLYTDQYGEYLCLLKDYTTVNWLLFVMCLFSPFSSVPSMTNLCTDKYKCHWLYKIDLLIINFERKYYHECSIILYCISDLFSTESDKD